MENVTKFHMIYEKVGAPLQLVGVALKTIILLYKLIQVWHTQHKLQLLDFNHCFGKERRYGSSTYRTNSFHLSRQDGRSLIDDGQSGLNYAAA